MCLIHMYFSGGIDQQAQRIMRHETYLMRSDLDQTLHVLSCDIPPGWEPLLWGGYPQKSGEKKWLENLTYFDVF